MPPETQADAVDLVFALVPLVLLFAALAAGAWLTESPWSPFRRWPRKSED